MRIPNYIHLEVAAVSTASTTAVVAALFAMAAPRAAGVDCGKIRSKYEVPKAINANKNLNPAG